MLLLDVIPESMEVLTEEKLAVFYVAGYIACKNTAVPSETSVYVWAFLREMNQSSLTYPSSNLTSCAWYWYPIHQTLSSAIMSQQTNNDYGHIPWSFPPGILPYRTMLSSDWQTSCWRSFVSIMFKRRNPAKGRLPSSYELPYNKRWVPICSVVVAVYKMQRNLWARYWLGFLSDTIKST